VCIISQCSFLICAKNEEFSWYCVRNKEHLQPKADANMSFIENYNGFYVDKNHSSTSAEKVIYLTFDAGYENGNIEKILNVLREENVSAAFFVLENLISKNPELILRMEAEGHLVCNHTAKHKDITKYSDINELKCELDSLEAKYTTLTGKEMKKYFRPPEGRFSEKSMDFLSKLGYKTIFWSFAYADWDNAKQPSVEYAKQKVFENIHNGEVMLLHPTSDTNAKILKDVILKLRSEGYRFGTLDELTK
jgi:peptidoglycan-N-acetylmuramic acid deacetylase